MLRGFPVMERHMSYGCGGESIKDKVLIIPLRLKNVVLISLRVFSLKRFTPGAFTVPFRV